MPPSREPTDAPPEGVVTRQLRQMIRDRGGSVESLGRESGIDPSQLRRFLAGQRDIQLGTLDRLAEVLGLRLIEGAKGRARATPAPKRPRATRPAST